MTVSFHVWNKRGYLTCIVASGIKVDGTASNEGGFGHPEENHDQGDSKCTSHSVEGCLVAAVLNDITGFPPRIS
jgi:hypothetical protein